MKKILFVAVLFLTVTMRAQTSFKEGYFIDNQGNKTTCLIKDLDWKNNPISFEYKLNTNDDIKQRTIDNTQEFSVLNKSIYQRFTVNIDRSESDFAHLNYNKHPNFSSEKLFLNLLIKGDASLYVYEDGNLRRFFFTMQDNNTATQLVYKRYKADSHKIGENVQFKQQLLNKLKCKNFSIQTFEKLKYSNESLTHLFIDYNECKNSNIVNYEKKNNSDREAYHLKLKAGIMFSSMQIANSEVQQLRAKFNTKASYRIGIEGEYILPFNNNKWSIPLEFAYSSYKNTATESFDTYSSVTTYESSVKYNHLEGMIGLRYYFFLNDMSRLYLNAQFVYSSALNSTITFMNGRHTIDLDNSNSLAFGAGYKFNKFSIELLYYTTTGVTHNYNYYVSDYNQLSLNLGYTLF
ncbi:tRNA modification GTPase [Zhouia sp. PK063]|uniref:tRNA modification GTPase n=1 Tax=Zhouia sp. PK063 TaxID=3373602 RepID=UPI0037A09E05